MKSTKMQAKASLGATRRPGSEHAPAGTQGAARGIVEASGIPVRCAYAAIMDIADLRPNPRNPKRHPEKQVALYARIIRQAGWRRPIVVSARSGLIVKGHGALEAAKLLQVETVPVDVQPYASEGDEWADMIADNQLSELGAVDERALAKMLADMGDEIRGATGFDERELKRMLAIDFVEGDDRGLGTDVTDKVPREREVYIVPIALTREEWARWEGARKGRGHKLAFLDLLKS